MTDENKQQNINPRTGLTEDEQIVMDSLVAAFNNFASLNRQHPDEMRDFTDGIHRLQDMLAVRIARRNFPKGWPTYSGGADGK